MRDRLRDFRERNGERLSWLLVAVLLVIVILGIGGVLVAR